MNKEFIRRNSFNFYFTVLILLISFVNPIYIHAKSLSTVFSTHQSITNQMWPVRYNGTGSGIDTPYDVLTDKNGYVYVTGSSYGANGTSDYATVKYDANGNQIWVARYNGPGSGNDVPAKLAVDQLGNIYVTGKAYNTNTGDNFTTIKYDTNGTQLWVKSYNGSGNGSDVGVSIAVDEKGFVYVVGSTTGSGTDSDVTTIKYDTNGNQVWIQQFNKAGTWQNMNDYARQILIDNNGNIYVIGTSDGFSTIQDYLILKYNADGQLLQVRTYNGTGDWLDRIEHAALDKLGNLYVVGESTGSGSDWDYATIKYAPDGNQLWVQRYNGPGNAIDVATSIAVDINANVYISGTSQNDQGISNYTTIKYDTYGNQIWLQRYDEPSYQAYNISQLALDSDNNVYVVGCVVRPTTGKDIITIKYTSDGTIVGSMQYNDPINGDDSLATGASAIFIDGSNNIYVSGQSDNAGTSTDYLTLKYSSVDFNVTTTPTPTGSPTATTPTPTSSPTAATPTPTSSPTAATPTPTSSPTATTPTPTSSPTAATPTPTGSPTATPNSGEYGITINNGALFTSQTDVILTVNAKSETTEMRVSNDGGFANAQWEPYTLHKAWQITRYGNYVLPRTVYIRYQDANGNVSSTYQDDILLDVTAPKGRIWISNDALYTTKASNIVSSSILHIEADDDVSGVEDMRLSNQSDFAKSTWEPFTTTYNWNFAQDTAVYVQFRDNAGNVSQTYSAQLASQKQLFLPFVQR